MSHKTLITSGCSFTQTELPFNWDKFISTGMYEWCKEENLLQEHDDKHPSEEGHKKYTEQFIEPHLNARSII